MPRVYRLLSDQLVTSLHDFAVIQTLWDTRVNGLLLRSGVHKTTWIFFQEHRIKGKRSSTYRRLGFWPAINTKAARKAALIEAGRIAAGRIQPGKRDAVTLAAAMVEYDQHLHDQSERRGKEPTWARIVASMARNHLLPAFGTWSLAELSAAPAAVRDFHIKVTKDAGPIAANHCCRILAALYKFSARLNRSLPPALPTSAVRYNVEKPSTAGLAFSDFPKWKAALDKIESPIRRSYFLICLLTGLRPSEAARLKWANLDVRSRTLTVPVAKMGNEIRIPLSVEIVRALKLARGADRALIFPGCKWPSADDPPVKGRALRRTYRTVAADLGMDEILTRLLMGHSLGGINSRYITQHLLTGGPGLRQAQAKISRRIYELFTPDHFVTGKR